MFEPNHANPAQGLAAWAIGFFDDFARTRPEIDIEPVADILSTDYVRAWTVATLAATTGIDPAALVRAFRRRYGISPRTFHNLLRLIEALGLIGQGKVEVAAMQVGYKSKKDLYRNMRQLTGLTPTAFRRLTPAQAAEVVESVRSRLQPAM